MPARRAWQSLMRRVFACASLASSPDAAESASRKTSLEVSGVAIASALTCACGSGIKVSPDFWSSGH